MFPAYEKRPGCPSFWDVTRRKVCSAPEECITINERTNKATFKARLLHSRSLGHHVDCLPAIKEPENTRVGTMLGLDESLSGSRSDLKVRLLMKRWKKISLSRSSASMSHFEPLESFRRIVRMVRMVIRIGNALKSDPKLRFREGICKSFLEIIETYTTTKDRNFTESRRDRPGSSSDALVFDPKLFKANKEVKISKEVKHILCARPEQRTSDQLQTVLYALQTLETFSELPLHMQQEVCKVAWLQSFPSNTIIIQQEHFPENFYFVITGTVTVLSENDPTKDSLYTSLATLKRGCSFGELAILRNCRRTATVISKDSVQLLVISKEDYQRIFMGHTKDGREPAHFKFCRSLEFLADWPVDLLLNNPTDCLFHYFKRGTVIVKDSNKSDWLYVIVSGVCQVLLGLEITKPKLTGKRAEEESLADKLADLTENRHRKSIYASTKSFSPAFIRSAFDEKISNNLPPVYPVTEMRTPVPRTPKKQTAFVQLGLLHPRSVFGLGTLLNFEEDFQLIQPASVSLVSRSAECVMISKKFFMAQASELTKKWIRHNVRSYPSRETLQKNLQERINWNAYKQDVVQDVVAR